MMKHNDRPDTSPATTPKLTARRVKGGVSLQSGIRAGVWNDKDKMPIPSPIAPTR
ncbi:MAG: hypothetical protein KC912_16655 [Proteobacteria bacterium]|nr:hypothetical protein [Pseudomonadota bacterium]